ncbi:hypothetical protein FM111_09825 [Brevundimonas diminuta 3F5N]|uniref:Uncharacterized protein n=1 Tax=Brevundimonas diminuta 3F5N TaxID=1255603 RepID=A0A1R4G6D3_BREDI|nr:hypothetical protein BDIM_19020 [Brevundimonas diminuta ATCC 11568]SJM63758.1 hypothetical protein FM111_09825 [Brevundimonas diminuta 3F5N]
MVAVVGQGNQALDGRNRNVIRYSGFYHQGAVVAKKRR